MAYRIAEHASDLRARTRATSAAERQAYLEQACGDDAGTCASRSSALLKANGEAGRLPRRAPASLQRTQPVEPITERARHGHRPVQAAGADRRRGLRRRVHGRADRSPVRRRVALKIIKPGMDTRQVIARFEAERQALALMDHPNIARVLDAGATESRPAVLRDGAGPGRADHRVLRPATTSRPRSGWSCSSRSARRCSTPIRRGSSTATSSRPTCW